jgi:hypothetical protein
MKPSQPSVRISTAQGIRKIASRSKMMKLMATM